MAQSNEWIKRMLSDKTFMKTIRARWITTKSSVDNWASTQIQTKADALCPDAKLNFQSGQFWVNMFGLMQVALKNVPHTNLKLITLSNG